MRTSTLVLLASGLFPFVPLSLILQFSLTPLVVPLSSRRSRLSPLPSSREFIFRFDLQTSLQGNYGIYRRGVQHNTVQRSS